MNAIVKSIMQPAIILAVCLVLFNLQPASADGNIDTTYKYAWSENFGWENFQSNHGGVTVNDTYLSGYAWAENIGWVKLGSGTGPYDNTTSANWGVNHNNGTGALSGYAWSENAGWINFNGTTHNPNGVSIDTDTLKFSGYAWAESVGYVHFQNASPEYYVKQEAGAPTVTTQAVSNIAATTATGNGNITDLGVPNPTEHGVCWSTSQTPTTNDAKTTQGAVSATGAFTSSITGLFPSTRYYVRAYAANAGGTSYGNSMIFTTESTSNLYVSSDGDCGDKEPCYGSIQDAVNDAIDGSAILVKQGTYGESITLGSPKTLLIKGGYDSIYTQQTANKTIIRVPGKTVIKAPSGAIKLEMVTIRP